MFFYQTLIASFFAVASASFDLNCANVANGVVVAVPKDCTKKATCNNGLSTITDCPTGQKFSTAQMKCVSNTFPRCFVMKKYCPTLPLPPNSAGRIADSYTDKQMAGIYGSLKTATIEEQQMLGFTADEAFVCPQESGYFSVENEKSSYRICVGGEAFVGKCEDDAVFDSESNICVDARDATKKSLPTDFQTSCLNDPNTGFVAQNGVFGYSKNCKLFQVCCGGVASMHKCPLGMGFDTASNACSFKPTCKTA